MHGRACLIRTALSLLVFLFAVACFGQQQSSDKNGGDGTIVVPAGTKITVHLDYGKREGRPYIDGTVAWPVRDGFTTLIPVGAKVRADVFVVYYSNPYNYFVPVEFIQLTLLTMGGKTYRLETDTQELMGGTAESKFTLVSDLRIEP